MFIVFTLSEVSKAIEEPRFCDGTVMVGPWQRISNFQPFHQPCSTFLCMVDVYFFHLFELALKLIPDFS